MTFYLGARRNFKKKKPTTTRLINKRKTNERIFSEDDFVFLIETLTFFLKNLFYIKHEEGNFTTQR